MGASGLEQKIGKLFEAAGYDISQAVGLEAGAVDWFAMPRAGLSRPKTYFVAWERCPEDLAGALAELERARVARRADKALGVVMEGRLPEGYKTDLGRVAEAITYRRLVLELSGVIDEARERISRYERDRQNSYYVRPRGRLRSGEDVDLTSYVESWSQDGARGNLGIVGSRFSGRSTLVDRVMYEISVKFLADPDGVTPFATYVGPYRQLALSAGLALDVSGDPPRRNGPNRTLYLVQQGGIEAHKEAENEAVELLAPESSDIEAYISSKLDPHTRSLFFSARQDSRLFRAMSDALPNVRHLLLAMQPAPSSTVENWIAQTLVNYMGSVLAMARPPLNPPAEYYATLLEEAAFEQFALGRISAPNVFRPLFPYHPAAAPLSTWMKIDAIGPTSAISSAHFFNALARDYFVARKIIRALREGQNDILTRYQFPKEHVLLFVATLSPETAAQLGADRSAEMRAQIEAEVERRLNLTLAHQIRRSIGVIRLNVGNIRASLRAQDEAMLAPELGRIEQELAYQSALVDRTGRWHQIPNGPDEPVGLHEVVSSVVAPLRQQHPKVGCEIDVAPAIRVRAKRSILTEIVHCIVENAFQAVAFARLSDPRVSIRASDDRATTILHVIDNGPGIHPGDREIIFEPYRTTKKGGDQPLGTGLGLAIARRYAERIGAEVTLDPDQAETCFVLKLVAWRDDHD